MAKQATGESPGEAGAAGDIPSAPTLHGAGRSGPEIPRARSRRPESTPHRRTGSRLALAALLALLLGGMWNARNARRAAFPEGLIQVNGRIEGDPVTIASKYSGRMSELLVREGDTVAAGQVLARLDDAETRARLRQAEANLQALEAQAGGAGETVALTEQTTAAQVRQADGVLGQAVSGVASAREELRRTLAAIQAASSGERTAAAQARGARAAFDSAQATLEAAEQTVLAADAAWKSAAAGHRTALAGVELAQNQVEVAEASHRAARAGIDAARAAFERAHRDAQRYITLYEEGAASASVRDSYVAAEKSARAALEGAEAQAAAAAKEVQARRSALHVAGRQAAEAEAAAAVRQAEVEARKRQVTAAEGAVRQARAHVEAADEETATAHAGVEQAGSQHRAAREAVRQMEAKRRQAAAQLEQAHTAPRQVAVSRTNRAEVEARIRQARAAVDELRSVLRSLTVVAPAAGTVTAKVQSAGEVIGAGSPLLEVVDLDRLYLKVFVPETEIGRLRLGLAAQVYTDAFPHRPFPAEVRYIASRAEFTPKEVQTKAERVKLVYAVKLYLTRNPDHQLTPGLPADAVVRWKDGTPWAEPRW